MAEPLFHRRHYKYFAKRIAEAKFNSSTQSEEQIRFWNDVEAFIADAFRHDNPKFNDRKFHDSILKNA